MAGLETSPSSRPITGPAETSGHLGRCPTNPQMGGSQRTLTFSDALASLEPEELKVMAASVPSWAAMVHTDFCVGEDGDGCCWWGKRNFLRAPCSLPCLPGPLACKQKALSMEFCYTILSSGSSSCCGEPMGSIRATYRATQPCPYC